ncbi:MAG: HAMP domain-containing sensor histidine kinase [Propionivibrio sp.]
MKRLYLRIYLIVIASLALFALLAALGWILFVGSDDESEGKAVLAEVVAELVPRQESAGYNQAVLERWHQRLSVALALFDRQGQLIAQAGAVAGDARPADFKRDDQRYRGRWHALWLPLPDGRFIGARALDGRHAWPGNGPGSGPIQGLAGLLGFLALIGVAVALAAWWPARQMTRRLESLQQSVDAFGAGDLQARAPIRGRDEIARLAAHFNESAERIGALLRSQRSLLANASHELRSPLARIRMAVELSGKRTLPADERSRIQQELQRNVAELDELVEEVLTSSRLDAADATTRVRDRIDLTGLVAEECARLNIEPDLDALEIVGDARLLRRLIRNLLENACRHGGRPQAIAVTLVGQRDGAAGDKAKAHNRQSHSGIVLAVCDHGPGVPAEERERIFEPFYRARGASEKTGGVGLGLSLVRQIAQHHGGQARCLERTGGGSCFEVWLPAGST